MCLYNRAPIYISSLDLAVLVADCSDGVQWHRLHFDNENAYIFVERKNVDISDAGYTVEGEPKVQPIIVDL